MITKPSAMIKFHIKWDAGRGDCLTPSFPNMVQNLARPVLWSLFTKKDFQIINQKGAISSLLSWQTKMQPRDHEQKFDYK